MAKRYLREFPSGSAVEQVFLVRSKALRAARNGSLYIELEVADRSGALPARVWNASQELFDSFDVDSFVEIGGRIETYRDQLQMVIHTIAPARTTTIDMGDFLPSTERDVEQMLAALRKLIAQVTHPALRALLDAFFKDREFCRLFARSPAAVQYHHATIGGLLEHSLSVAELAVLVAERYPAINGDLLLTGAILHDVGKIDELTSDRSFRYTDAGQLIGHVTLGVLRLEDRAKQVPDFPEPLLNLLRHLILSHHGEYEFGAPKLPMSLEALALHHLDNLDAKANAFQQIIKEDRDPSSTWTDWSRMFDRKLYKGTGLDDEQ